MSEELKQFYRDLQAWIDAGKIACSAFSIDTAVCSALRYWAIVKLGSTTLGERQALLEENENLFISHGLHESYPFNNGESCGWDEEEATGTFYKNPERLAFIKEMAK
ncbi:hypothetical protein ACLEDU_02455 [Lonsdalea quercina]|uniref:hypothetical protein n=1 Tax=Lonsdalea quercina TaxID=71657 RepID=UPI003976F3DB